jgi:MFS family permease
MNKKPRLLTNTLIVLLISMIAANIGGQMWGPLLPLYVQSLGANIEQIGLFFTLAMIAPLMFQILGGWLSDAIGRVQAMAIGSVAGFAGYLIFIISPSWGWLLLAMVGLSVATSFVGPSFQALVAEESSEESRGRVFGIVQSLFLVVGVIGAPLGGLLADQVGFRWMFGVAAALYGVATVIRVYMSRKIRRQELEAPPENAKPRSAPSFSYLKTSLTTLVGLMVGGGIVTWIFISDGVGDVTFSMVGNLFPLYLNNIIGLSKTQLGIMGAVASIVTMAFTTLGGMLSDKAGERVGIVLGNIFIGIAIFLMLNISSYALFIAAWALLGLGQALSGPAYNSLISKVVPAHLRGTAFGFFSTSLGLISLPAPFIGTWLWEKFGARVPFYVPLVALMLMLPVIWFKFKLPKSNGKTPQAETTPEADGSGLIPLKPDEVPQDAAAD